MDPNVQVALIGVMATFITTLGVVATAIINNLRTRANAAEKVVEKVVEHDLDEEDVMEKILLLIGENERKEKFLAQCRREVHRLTREVRQLRAENIALRLSKFKEDPDT